MTFQEEAAGLQVDPATVGNAADVFQEVADRIRAMVAGAAYDLRLQPWLGKGEEPVSAWAAEQFNQHYEQLLRHLDDLGKQHQQMADRLKHATSEYSAADEASADRFRKA